MKRLFNRNVIDTTVFFVVLAGVWEFSVAAFDIKPYLLPSVSAILSQALLAVWRSSSARIGP